MLIYLKIIYQNYIKVSKKPDLISQVNQSLKNLNSEND